MDTSKKIKAGQRVVVLGMGISGRAMVAFLRSVGAQVLVSDSRQFAELQKDDQKYLLEQEVPFEGGGHSEEFLGQADYVVISPGVPTDLPVLSTMRKRGIPVIGELAIAAPYLSETVIAVTGTNGKTTVTALIADLLEASGKRVFVGGNIGTPLLNYLLSDERADVLVLELSSFQLESAGTFRPHIGILLNVTPDHLDRHGSMVAYSAAKMKMFAHQQQTDTAIVCGDDPMCQQIAPLLLGQNVLLYGTKGTDYVATGSKDLLQVRLKERQEVFHLEGSRLYSHNGFLNSCAALVAASCMGCEATDMQRGLMAFVPASHRLQHVRQIDGVDYYNDSKATNSGAVLSAMASFAGNIILIAGGRDKGEDFGILHEAAQDKLKGLVVIGEAANKIEAAIGTEINTCHAASMEEAVRIAFEMARSGDVVLLAPACASFDMFDNYVHRGELFMELVHNLPAASPRRAA